MTCDKQPCECKLQHRQKRIKNMRPGQEILKVIIDEAAVEPEALEPKQFFGSIFPRLTGKSIKRFGSEHHR